MDFKLVSKNNMGIVATLILVILLSQSKFFNFLIDTGLGRAVLIFFIILISYVNKILGVVAVLFIIIIFNQSNIGYMEGFTSTPGNSAVDDKLKAEKLKLNNLKQQNNATATTSAPTTSAPATSAPATSAPATSAPATSAPSNVKTETFTGREGFNTVDRENTMLRGKRSNEIPVLSNARSQSDSVEPTDTSVFANTYSSF